MSAPRSFLITGAARGIGRGLSRLLLKQGHQVFLVDNNWPELQHTAALLSKSFHHEVQFEVKECDLRSPGSIKSAIASAKTFFIGGRLDVLINNAGYTAGVGGAKLEDEGFETVWKETLDVNLTGTVLMTRECLGMLRKSRSPSDSDDGAAGGNLNSSSSSSSIINISSTRAHQSEAHSESYAASKAGLIGLSHALAVSLNASHTTPSLPPTSSSPSAPAADRRIRVNTILPGWIHVGDENHEADQNGTKWEDGLSKEDHLWHLTGRVGNVEDVLRAVEFLVESEGITGTEVVVDGGVTRKMVYPE
jgi:NAD(P)-dependent dehydrogenase (short-subunit alcohol dehydrogenase family)